MVGRPSEQAEVSVSGPGGAQILKNWESVWVQAIYGDPVRYFRFTVSEGKPLASNFADLRAAPGDAVRIFLGGRLALTGYINWRQVAYDAYRHGVLLQGRGNNQDPIDSSVITKAGGGEFNGYKLEAIAAKVLAPFKIQFIMKGDSGAPFESVQTNPTETVMNFIDRLARMRGVVLGEDENGNLIGLNENMGVGTTGALVEGQNIKEAQCLIQDPMLQHAYAMYGQGRGSDKRSGKTQNQLSAYALDPTVKRYRPRTLMAPRPPENVQDLQTLLDFEVHWRQGTYIDADITVYGWLRSEGSLWNPGDSVHVTSPMLLLNQELKIAQCTFIQDKSTGTVTELKVTNRLGRFPDYSGGNPSTGTGGGGAAPAVPGGPAKITVPSG